MSGQDKPCPAKAMICFWFHDQGSNTFMGQLFSKKNTPAIDCNQFLTLRECFLANFSCPSWSASQWSDSEQQAQRRSIFRQLLQELNKPARLYRKCSAVQCDDCCVGSFQLFACLSENLKILKYLSGSLGLIHSGEHNERSERPQPTLPSFTKELA